MAIKDNEVVTFGTNLKKFVQQLNDMEISSRNYAYFYRIFRKGNLIKVKNEQGIGWEESVDSGWYSLC